MALPKLLFFAATASAASAAADDQSCLLQAKPSSGDLNDQSGALEMDFSSTVVFSMGLGHNETTGG